ncbi:MAG: outer membrane beta-barrel protein [Campylobacterota bacterium]|nr:outer membrane beta-barrel protein [Campylobacterota bacterium]
MKKSFVLILTLLATLNLYSSEDGSGTYFGFGVGDSRYTAGFHSEGCYIDENDGFTIKKYDVSDKAYKFYGGYQFNKIVALEASFTNYGTFVASQKYTQKPKSVALYANVGYSFFNPNYAIGIYKIYLCL